MKKVLIVLAVLALAATAGAQNLVLNGTFEDLSDWTVNGAALVNGDFGAPASPGGNPAVGFITCWGAGTGTAEQTIDFTGDLLLSADLYAAAHLAGDPTRPATAELFWNGVSVANVTNASGDGWAAETAWQSFTDIPVTGTGVNTLKIQFVARSAEWTWTQADNISLTAVPEPGSLLALGSGLIGLAGFAIRRRR